MPKRAKTEISKTKKIPTWILKAFPTADSIGLHTPKTPCGLSAGAVSRDNFSLTSETSIRLKRYRQIIIMSLWMNNHHHNSKQIITLDKTMHIKITKIKRESLATSLSIFLIPQIIVGKKLSNIFSFKPRGYFPMTQLEVSHKGEVLLDFPETDLNMLMTSAYATKK